jgi:hypothetical protein
MQNGPKTIMRARQPGPAASFAARPKRWTSSTAHPEPKSTQNAQRNYERYLALARAEAQIGNIVGAENYYQHAEHYFRSMYSEGTSEPFLRRPLAGQIEQRKQHISSTG